MADKSIMQFGGTKILTKTGQTTSYTGYDDGYYQAGNPVSPRYVDNGDGTISDRATALMWVKQPELIIPDLFSGGEILTFSIANSGSNYTATGYLTILDINGYECVFSITAVDGGGAITGLNLAYGGILYSPKSNCPTFAGGNPGSGCTLNILTATPIVRSAQIGNNQILVARGDWVTEGGYSAGDLVSVDGADSYPFTVCVVANNDVEFDWEKWRISEWTATAANLTSPKFMDWDVAIGNCIALEYAGHYDWRFPNVKELHSIADFGRINPAIDPLFANCQPNSYWSSTTQEFSSDWAHYVEFSNGTISSSEKLGAVMFVRPVRGGINGSSILGMP